VSEFCTQRLKQQSLGAGASNNK